MPTEEERQRLIEQAPEMYRLLWALLWFQMGKDDFSFDAGGRIRIANVNLQAWHDEVQTCLARVHPTTQLDFSAG